ncbi:methyltransferase domain-containing protein [Sphingomonas sp. JC676]|uniref:class I SAM-dependent methyltransferase n=1 Tax=Sphingomonas sp. JC676 TaxID=2768065 RepID=UPI001657C9CC|nr:methyltransferase domain-containing protein [Sphingomonas sp. JC676]MBC9031174.1 methyltransferase domain-containing protein [Sphingomonas sp. JC676]
MLVDLDLLEPLLCCPRTRVPLVRDGVALRCVDDDRCSYAAVQGAPVLVDFARSILSLEQITENDVGSPVRRRATRGIKRTVKRVLSPEKKSTRRNIDRLIAALPRDHEALVLIIGGGTVGQGIGALYDHPNLGIAAFDIYYSPNIQFIADAHSIPLRDRSVDAVVIQAVLEHVLDPQQVVDEIWRVLKPDGLVYAETPFLQHVHEGAYDFTRFTESGHRFLFRRFELVDSGISGGPGTQLIWSIDYFARALFRSRLAGKMFKLAFSWLQLFDAIVPSSYASDAASGVYFLGRRSNRTVSPQEIIAFYRGAQAIGPV